MLSELLSAYQIPKHHVAPFFCFGGSYKLWPISFIRTGHPKFHITLTPPSATDPGRTAGAPLLWQVQAVSPHSLSLFSCPEQRSRHLCPGQACATTACSERARDPCSGGIGFPLSLSKWFIYHMSDAIRP